MKTNLFIFNFKNIIRRNSNIIIFWIIFIMFFTLLGRAFEYIHFKNIGNNYDPKLRWDEFYGLKKNSIDIIFLGSSHAYRSFDPQIIDSNTNAKSFNLGSSSQMPDTGYYILKEALDYQTPKLLVYELYWVVLEEEYNIVQAKYNYEFMKNSQNKKDLFKHVFNTKDKIEYSIKLLRYRRDVSAYFNSLILNQVINLKKMRGDLNTEHNVYYRGKGFVYSDGIVSKEDLIEENEFKNYKFTALNSIQMEYLEKTIALCKEKGIKVLFVTAPIAPDSLHMIKNYKDIHNNVNSFAKEQDIPYIDYNYINEEFKILNNSDFLDDDHLNYSGVKIFNKKLCDDIIKGQFLW